MTKRIEEYSVGQLAQLSGVTVRTLHHYAEIGLLNPAHVGLNGYRIYRRAELLRLQEILFYRAIGMPLAEIADVLDGPGQALERLQKHRQRLCENARKAAEMLATLDETIAHLKGAKAMDAETLYTPFAAEQQAEYEAWLVETYGADMAEKIATSKAHLDAVPEGMEERMAALKEIEAALVADYEAGMALQDAELAAHRQWVGSMWGYACDRKAHAGLADVYLGHPDFIARYEALAPGFSQWLTTAMKANAD